MDHCYVSAIKFLIYKILLSIHIGYIAIIGPMTLCHCVLP